MKEFQRQSHGTEITQIKSEDNKMDKSINIFYEANDELIGIVATSIVSICKNSKRELKFYILDTGLCEHYKKQLISLNEYFKNCSIEFIKVDLKQFQDLRGYTQRNFVDCYARLLIPELVKNINKAIYIDSDTLALQDIGELWDIDLGNKALAAPPDTGFNEVWKKHMVNNLHCENNQIYFSAGIFVINCKKWREEKISANLLEIAKERKNDILIIIEDLFTIYFKNKDVVLLDPKWGYIENKNENASFIPVSSITENFLEACKRNPAVIHFGGPNKVWKTKHSFFSGGTVSYFYDFWFYAKFTPFYAGLLASYISNIGDNCVGFLTTQYPIKRCPIFYFIKIFGFIPFIKVKEKKYKKTYYLFNFIPICKITKIDS